jgi:RNA polymerase sigma-70 factor (ECF subfamily)
MEDKLLVFRCKRGSSNALARVYQKYKRDLLVLAMALLNDTSVAEDAVHDVFVTFVQNLKQFNLTGSLKGYLLTCVANRARNINKNKAKREPNIGSNMAQPVGLEPGEPSQSIICNEALEQLDRAMAQLPYEQRETMMLHLHARMTFSKIAEQQQISVNTAKSRYRYGLEKLRLILNHEANK